MDRSLGFGSIICDLIRPFQTRSRFDSIPYLVFNLATYNNSPDRSTKSTISRLKSLYLLVNIGFQVLFHSPPGVLFTFPSRYCFTIGHQVVFSLWGWSPNIHTRFPVSRTTPDTTMLLRLLLTRLSLSLVCLSKQFCQSLKINYVVHNPIRITSHGLGSSSFARHYSRNRVFFLFLQVLRCFSSLRSLLTHYFTHVQITGLLPPAEFPHSDICGYNGYLLLPTAFRSLSRPSSALGAKAFTLCSQQLNLLLHISIKLLVNRFYKLITKFF